MIVDNSRFLEVTNKVASLKGKNNTSIGTLNESTVHAALKNYYEPHTENHEQTVGGFVADIVGENGVIEIQTTKFSGLAKKLPAFLSCARVKIVYPVYTTKTMVAMNLETGEVERRRKSPTHDAPSKAFRDLFPIAEFLSNPALSIEIVSLEIDEIRVPSEQLGKDPRKNGRHAVYDRVPTKLLGIIEIYKPHDWVKMIPSIYEEEFSTIDVKKSIDSAHTSAALGVLTKAGIIERTGKKDRYNTYRAKLL